MIETLVAYLIIIAPSLVTILGGIATAISCINKMRANAKNSNATIADALAAVHAVEAKATCENEALKKALIEMTKAATLTYEELKRIHQLHPEWIEGGDSNGQV